MRFKEIHEASRAERAKQKKAANQEKLQTPPITATPNPRSAYVKKQLTQFDPSNRPTQSDADNTGAFSSSEFDKYKVDDTIDTSFEGGYYLRFVVNKQLYGYFSKNPDVTFDQIKEHFPNQIVPLGQTVDTTAIQSLIDRLVQQTGKGDQPGYVHVILDRNINRYKQVYYQLLEFLLKQYPHDDYTVSGTVGWEDQNR